MVLTKARDPSARSISKMLERAAPVLLRLPLVTANSSPSMVEVGVSVGIMADYLLNERRDLSWWGVDPWLGHEDQTAAYVGTGDGHAMLASFTAEVHYQEARRRLERHGKRATIIRKRSPEAAAAFKDASVDLVFLDGDHSAEGCLADCRAWWPKVRSAGWLGGHDWDNPDPRFRFGVRKAVETWSKEAKATIHVNGGLTWWARRP